MSRFRATYTLKIVVDKDIKGETFEEALKNAEDIYSTDLVEVKGDFLDSEKPELFSISKEDSWL